MNWTDNSRTGRYDTLQKSRVFAYNDKVFGSFHVFSLTIISLVYIYLLSLFAAIKIYQNLWVKLSIFTILYGSTLVFSCQIMSVFQAPKLRGYLRDFYCWEPLKDVPFYWTTPLIVITAGIVISRWLSKPAEPNLNHKLNRYTNIAFNLLVVCPAILYLLGSHAGADIVALLSSIGLILGIILLISILLFLWVFYRSQQDTVTVDLNRILVVGKTSKQYDFEDIIDLAVFKHKNNSNASDVRAREGVGAELGAINDQTGFAIIFGFIVDIFAFIFKKSNYILIKDRHNKVSKIYIFTYENEKKL